MRAFSFRIERCPSVSLLHFARTSAQTLSTSRLECPFDRLGILFVLAIIRGKIYSTRIRLATLESPACPKGIQPLNRATLHPDECRIGVKLRHRIYPRRRNLSPEFTEQQRARRRGGAEFSRKPAPRCAGGRQGRKGEQDEKASSARQPELSLAVFGRSPIFSSANQQSAIRNRQCPTPLPYNAGRGRLPGEVWKCCLKRRERW